MNLWLKEKLEPRVFIRLYCESESINDLIQLHSAFMTFQWFIRNEFRLFCRSKNCIKRYRFTWRNISHQNNLIYSLWAREMVSMIWTKSIQESAKRRLILNLQKATEFHLQLIKVQFTLYSFELICEHAMMIMRTLFSSQTHVSTRKKLTI